METRYNVGDQVQLIADSSRIGVVLEVGPLHGGLLQYYKISWNVGTISSVAEGDLRTADVTSNPYEFLARGELGGYREFQRAITYERLSREKPLTNNLHAINASRTRFFPYQFKPLLKFLDSANHRLLIADEVGLGKTIEAGLILTELLARQKLQRVLIVCPSNLRDKWQAELLRRFGEHFELLDADRFTSFLRNYEEDPDRTKLNGIISIESLRGRKIIEQMEAQVPTFDYVVVDEAHHMRNFGTQNRRAGQALANGASAMVMLTATPIHLGDENLFSLLNLLDEGEFPDAYTVTRRFANNEPVVLAQASVSRVPPQLISAREYLDRAGEDNEIANRPAYSDASRKLAALEEGNTEGTSQRQLHIGLQRDLSELNLIGHVFTRTRKREVQELVVERHPFVLQVTFTERERAFYDAVTEFVQQETTNRDLQPGVQTWLLQTPQRRMASCIPAMVEWYRDRVGLTLEDLSEDEAVTGSNDLVEAETSLGSPATRLRELVRRWPRDGADSKYEHLLGALRTFDEQSGDWKCLIFAFYKGTLKYLSRRLSDDGYGNLLLSGDVPSDQRTGIIDQFRDDGDVRVLLSSRVGGEGLDFQFCDTVFNYDLPWNPMEVEQRIGRLDRIGQDSPTIRIYNFSVEGTIEQRILDRLYTRIGIFERSIGELEGILGEVVNKLERDLLSRSLTDEEMERRVDSAALVIEQRQDELRRLESESAQLVGVEEYYQAEVASITDRRRYVTSTQLERFVLDFLRSRCPETRLAMGADGEGEAFPCEELRQFLSHAGSRPIDTQLLASTGSQGIAVTFDSSVAFNKPNIEFINVVHPLVRAIARDYDNVNIVPATHVALADDSILAPGYYYFFVNKVVILSVRERSILEVVVLNENLVEACEPEEAESLLGLMAEKGEEPRGGRPIIEPEAVEAAHQQAQDLFHVRLGRARADYERSNDAILNGRIASITAFYERKLSKTRERLARGEAQNAQVRYRRMLIGTISNIERDQQALLDALESKRVVGVESHEVATGILEITNRPE